MIVLLFMHQNQQINIMYLYTSYVSGLGKYDSFSSQRVQSSDTQKSSQ